MLDGAVATLCVMVAVLAGPVALFFFSIDF